MRSLPSALALTLLCAARADASRPPAGVPPAPWEGPAFHASPGELVSAAAALPVDGREHLDFLSFSTLIRYEADGTAGITNHLVVRLLSPSAVQYFSSFSFRWRPLVAERPSIRARVVSPSGAEHVLDPSTVVETAGDRGAGDVLTDLRMVRAPLPGVERGAVVEIESVLSEREPIPGAGLFHEVEIAPPRTRRSRVVVDAPLGLPLHHAFRGAGGSVPAPQETTAGGRRRLAWRWKDLPDRTEREPDEPDREAGNGHLTISTARSWAAVADAYRKALERKEGSAEVAALAREIASGATSRDAQARRILDWMASRLRYTGLALGLAALVPVEPGEVLRRRYGDCKDLAFVFASMMRALGHETELALVQAGPDDLDPAVPSLGAFNHAVARVAGERPLWVDATMPDLPVGEVPPSLQQHAALLIRPGAAALDRIPAVPPGPEDVLQEFELRLGESGPAEVRELATLTGMMAALERRRARLASPEQLEKVLVEEEKERLRAGEASVELLASEPGRVAFRGKGTGSAWGSATDDTAEARLEPRAIRCAPEPLLPWKAGGQVERKAPLRIWQPCRWEVRHRVVVASGLRPSVPLPEGVHLAEGPLRFEASFEATGDGGISARYRLELDRGLLTAEQVGRIRKALQPLGAQGPLVEFRRTSLDLLEAGRGREALDEIRRLIAAEPSEVGHRIRLALALHRLGLGSAARAAARRAVEMAPESGWAHRILEIVLEADLLGRRLEPGCDLAGAIAAQRRAVALEPRSRSTRAYLGTLLLYGDRCVYFGGGADPAEAAAVLGAIPDLDEEEGGPEGLMHALLALGKDREAVALARERPAGLRRNAALLAGLALSEGIDIAVAEAGRLPPADRGEASRVAAIFVARRREYRLAGDLLERGSAGAENSAAYQSMASWLRRTRRLDRAPGPPQTPEAMAGALAEAGVGLRPLEPLLARARGPGEIQVPKALVEALVAGERLYGPPQVVAEVAAAAPLRWEPAGGDGGRLSIGDRQVFLLREADGWKLLAILGENTLLAERALTLIPGGRVDDARRWLAWAVGESTDSYRAEVLDPIAAAPPESLRLLAAALEADESGAQAALEVLEAARAGPLPAAVRPAVLIALANALLDAKRPRETIAAAEEALRSAPRSVQARTLRIYSLGDLGRLDELRQLAALARQELPADPELLRSLCRGAVRGGDLALVVATLETVSALPQVTAGDLNDLAWTRLFLEGSLTAARGEAQRAVDLSGGRDPSVLHTLATVLAANGEPAQAMEALRKAAEQRGWVHPADWLVVGRVAEAYGLPEAAREAYGKVEDGDFGPLSPRILAERWLARLDHAAAR